MLIYYRTHTYTHTYTDAWKHSQTLNKIMSEGIDLEESRLNHIQRKAFLPSSATAASLPDTEFSVRCVVLFYRVRVVCSNADTYSFPIYGVFFPPLSFTSLRTHWIIDHLCMARICLFWSVLVLALLFECAWAWAWAHVGEGNLFGLCYYNGFGVVRSAKDGRLVVMMPSALLVCTCSGSSRVAFCILLTRSSIYQSVHHSNIRWLNCISIGSKCPFKLDAL